MRSRQDGIANIRLERRFEEALRVVGAVTVSYTGSRERVE
jgi:hypothetical protein